MHLIHCENFNLIICQKEKFKEYGDIFVIFFRKVLSSQFEVEHWFSYAISKLPGSEQLNAFVACEMFQKNRAMTATILRALPDSAFLRTGIHTESGKATLEQMLDKYIEHLRHHLVFIAKKRRQLETVPSVPEPMANPQLASESV